MRQRAITWCWSGIKSGKNEMELHKLKARQVEALKTPGRYSDGGGLYLIVRGEASKSWVVISNKNGVRRERGLGSASKITLAEARKLAKQVKEEVHKVHVPTFEILAKQMITFWARNKGWAQRTHEQYCSVLENHAKPILKLPV